MRIRNKIVISTLAIIISTTCFAQHDNVDSMKRALSALRDTSRIDGISALWVHYVHHWMRYMHQSDKDSAFYYQNMGYEESKKMNFINGIARAFTQKAWMAFRFDADFAQVEQMAREALKWYELTPNKTGREYAMSIFMTAISNNENSDYVLAELNQIYTGAKQTNNKWVMHNCLESLASAYRDRGDYDSLVAAQQKLIDDDRSDEGNKEYTTHELWVMGVMYMLLDEYPTALTYWRQLFMVDQGGDFTNVWNQMEYATLLTLANQPDSAIYYYDRLDTSKVDRTDKGTFLVSKGEYYLFLDDLNDALPCFKKALNYFRQVKDSRQTRRTLIDIAKTYVAFHICDSAIAYARDGLAIAVKTKSKPAIRDAYQVLSTAYDQLEKSDSANLYFKKYITAKDSVLTDQTRGRFATYNYRQKIASLNKERQLQSQRLEREKINRYILIGALMIGLLLCAFLVRNIQLKRRKDQLQHLVADANVQLENRKKDQQIAEMQQQKTELEMQALRAQMNPHFIFNSLNSINMFILENDRLRASDYLSKFSRLVRLILQNSQEARIPLERELEALRLYLELESLRFNNKFEYNIRVEDDVDATVLKVPPLIIQPYVENAIWHGLMHKRDKGNLDIEVSRTGETLICKVIDNGVGRTAAEEMKRESRPRHKSMGIEMTESRIAMSETNGGGRSVEIKDLVYPDGSPAGTEVVLKIPAIIN